MRDKNPALLLIDMQKGFDDENYWGGNRNNKDAEQKAKIILDKWRELKLPVIHIKHSSQDPKSLLHSSHPGFEIIDLLKPSIDELVITKNVNSAFIGTNLKDILDSRNIKSLVIVGLTTNHCISTTTRMAGNFGYEVFLLSDATATFDRVGINGEKYTSEEVHLLSLANLKDEFAEILNSNKLMKIL